MATAHSNPRAAALRAARQRHQQELEAFHPGEVTIGDDVYTCAQSTGPWEPKPLDDGINYREGQDLVVMLSKSKLPVAPEPKTLITVDDQEFRIVHVENPDEFETSWRILARRFA